MHILTATLLHVVSPGSRLFLCFQIPPSHLNSWLLGLPLFHASVQKGHTSLLFAHNLFCSQHIGCMTPAEQHGGCEMQGSVQTNRWALCQAQADLVSIHSSASCWFGTWASLLTFLCLSFLTCKTGGRIPLSHGVEWDNMYKDTQYVLKKIIATSTSGSHPGKGI